MPIAANIFSALAFVFLSILECMVADFSIITPDIFFVDLNVAR
jgi:hypothetical protein